MKAANRVAINTFVQYIQLILNVIIGLYSVRVILNALGASDYGIFDLIAGVVGLLTFISNSLSQTSMRYLSVCLGKDDANNTRKTFSTCFWLHILISVSLSIILLSVSPFIFNGILNIDESRILTAKKLYYFMVFQLFLNISVTPFSALIAAHEKFVYISCIQILDSVLKLGIAFIIASSSRDRLLTYGVLMVTITVINVLSYIIYVLVQYHEKISFHKVSFCDMKEVTGFAGWTILDVAGSVATRQGYAILLNTFFGTVINAVFALSRQIEGHLYTVSASVINTMKPQIMKSQGAGDNDRMFRLSLTAGKFGFSMMSLVSIPLLVMMPGVLSLWLKEVPEGTVLFSRLMISACMIEQMTRGLVYANQAVGNIKWFSLIISTIRIIALPISWIFFHFGAAPFVAIIVFCICEALGSFSRVIILSKISDFKVSSFIRSVFIQLLPPFCLSFLTAAISNYFFHGISGMLLTCLISATSYAIIMWICGLTSEEKQSIEGIVRSVIR